MKRVKKIVVRVMRGAWEKMLGWVEGMDGRWWFWCLVLRSVSWTGILPLEIASGHDDKDEDEEPEDEEDEE